jgi:SAM-dependent MidA family methyltransferase
MHVDWASIADRASRNGLNVAGFTDQHHFLTGIISAWPDLVQDRAVTSTGIDHKSNRALQTLLHPEMLGRAFQVLALGKNVDASAVRLAGFKFAREITP